MHMNSPLHRLHAPAVMPELPGVIPCFSGSIQSRHAVTARVSQRNVVTAGRCFAVFQQNRAAGHLCLPVEAGAVVAHASLPTTTQASSSLPTTIRR